MKVININAKNILNPSKVYDYTVNPYVGCAHGCHYCYARFIKRFLHVEEMWGNFICVKVNAPELLEKEVKKKKKGDVWISGICDPYQPIERTLRLTRTCIKILLSYGWNVYIQTKSNIILDDLDLLKSHRNVHVYFTITTVDEKVKEIFEPKAPPIHKRIEAVSRLYSEGIETHVMIAPLLLGADGLVEKLRDKVYSVIIDKMNYHYADWVYEKYKIQWTKSDRFFVEHGRRLKNLFEKYNVRCTLLY
ncbi:MAG: radical SAM protein [Deltaproteobacteria bacterium]|nr:radical SAM protein [Deltaproteobacteria bacterium]